MSNGEADVSPWVERTVADVMYVEAKLNIVGKTDTALSLLATAYHRGRDHEDRHPPLRGQSYEAGTITRTDKEGAAPWWAFWRR